MSNIYRNPQQNDQPAPKNIKGGTGMGSGKVLNMTGSQNGGKVINPNGGRNMPMPKDIAASPKIGGRGKR